MAHLRQGITFEACAGVLQQFGSEGEVLLGGGQADVPEVNGQVR